MNSEQLKAELCGMDIYLLDQVLKGRLNSKTKILDAGCGTGRNVKWFMQNGFDVCGMDASSNAIEQLQAFAELNAYDPTRFAAGKLESLSYENDAFDLVICNAVLHFAESQEHFKTMFSELCRVLKPEGLLFIRMTSDIGLKHLLESGKEGVFLLPDGTHRFLLNKSLLNALVDKHKLKFIEPLKTVNVNDLRCMSTLVLNQINP